MTDEEIKEAFAVTAAWLDTYPPAPTPRVNETRMAELLREALHDVVRHRGPTVYCPGCGNEVIAEKPVEPTIKRRTL